MSACVHTCICMYFCVYVCIHIYIYKYMCMHIYIYINIYIYTYIYACIHTYIHVCILCMALPILFPFFLGMGAHGGLSIVLLCSRYTEIGMFSCSHSTVLEVEHKECCVPMCPSF